MKLLYQIREADTRKIIAENLTIDEVYERMGYDDINTEDDPKKDFRLRHTYALQGTW